MRKMSRTGESIGRLDLAIAVALSAVGLLLMYGNVTDAEVDASWLAMPVFLAVTIPVLWRRAAPLHAMAAVGAALAVHVALFGSVVRCGVVFPVDGAARVHASPRASGERRAVGARGRSGHHRRHGAADAPGSAWSRCSCR